MAKENKINKGIEQLKEAFVEQIRLLEDSARSFDDGKFREAKRIALALRILLHDTNIQKSLLGQLGVKKHIPFLNTSHGYSEKNLVASMCLLSINMSNTAEGETAKYLPIFEPDRQKLHIAFDKWWDDIIIDDKKNVFSRGKLVLFVANQDGGAHVDAGLGESYYNLKYNNSLGWEFVNSRGEVNPLDNEPALMSIRQICYEFLYSIKFSKNKTIVPLGLGDLYLYDKLNY